MVKSKFQNPKSKINPNFKIPNPKLCVLFVICNLCIGISYAQSLSSTELISKAKEYDGKVVVYEGEVIGDVMARGDFAWANINDGAGTLGVWIDKNLAREIIYTGNYKTKGDWVEVTGIFQRACPQHGADLDIHAQAIRKIRPGRTVNKKLNPDKKRLVLILLGVLGAVWILRLLKRK